MAEMIFILVTIYFVYVVHSTLSFKKENKVKDSASKIQVSAADLLSNKSINKTVAETKTLLNKTKEKSKKVKASLFGADLRNPKTGEVAKIASSYRMTKRWIKEALVSEGLLEKIYKTNELNDVAKEKINIALLKLETIEKYH